MSAGIDHLQDALGQRLINTLVSFTESVIQRWVSPSVNLELQLTSQHSVDIAELENKVISALEQLIKATMQFKMQSHEGRLGKVDDLGTDIKLQPETIPGSENVESQGIDISEEIQTGIREALRPHVFNKMPIRLLTFNSTGNEIRLIDRSKTLLRIKQDMQIASRKPEFVADWMEAKEMTLSDDIDAWKVGYNRKKQLINNLVSRYARLGDTETRADNPLGYAKIAKFCKAAALNHGVTLGWMDTVCINKDSSSELDESIRSMYKWYRGADICLAYLADTIALHQMHSDPWFTRGWTLQELLAPHKIHFYNAEWKDLCSYDNEEPTADPNLGIPLNEKLQTSDIIQNQILEATSMTANELSLINTGGQLPISRIFQLSTYREVTREEDASYSLMGLLGVDMSVAYGEGSERAFLRLLHELLTAKKFVLDVFNHVYWRTTNNTLMPTTIDQYSYRSITFEDPVDHASSTLDQWQMSEPIMVTHLGVRVPLLLLPALRSLQSHNPADISYTPLGDISGVIDLYVLGESGGISDDRYYLLDRRIFGDDITSDFPSLETYMDVEERLPEKMAVEVLSFHTEHDNMQFSPGISDELSNNTTFGVFNFGIDNGNILLPEQCMSVLLNCGKIKPGKVEPSDKVKIMGTELAPVFELECAGNTRAISIEDLKKHGLQAVTLYL